MIRQFESKQEECLVILMEECGELVQEICKMMRKNDYNSVDFTKEVGDVIAMLQIAQELGLFTEQQVIERAAVKKAKLTKWSHLYDEERED